MSRRPSTTTRVATSGLTLALALGLSGCGTSQPDPGGAGATSTTASATTSALVIQDGWVKAVDTTESMGSMSAMFGVLRNTSDDEVTVTGGASPVAGRVELHETVKNASGAMQMQPKAAGVVIPAGGSATLEPGGDHVMLMELEGDLATGSDVSVTLRTSAGDVTVTVPVRTFPGAEESYAPSPATS